MAFGKRPVAPSNPSRPSINAIGDGRQPSRAQQLRDHMVALLGTARVVADAVRVEGVFPMPAIADAFVPEEGPLALKGFPEYFTTRGAQGPGHVIFAYGQPGGGGIDPNAQYHLQQLTGQILTFNLYCQRAAGDEALAVALQAPEVPHLVDAILIRSAYFAAFFDNMLGICSGPADLQRQRSNLDNHLLMAQDKMLDPGRRASLVPLKGWPFIGVEVPYPPHDGDAFVNGVYFPAEYARLLLEGRDGAGRFAAVA